jgi:hypothetical protein
MSPMRVIQIQNKLRSRERGAELTLCRRNKEITIKAKTNVIKQQNLPINEIKSCFLKGVNKIEPDQCKLKERRHQLLERIIRIILIIINKY